MLINNVIAILTCEPGNLLHDGTVQRCHENRIRIEREVDTLRGGRTSFQLHAIEHINHCRLRLVSVDSLHDYTAFTLLTKMSVSNSVYRMETRFQTHTYIATWELKYVTQLLRLQSDVCQAYPLSLLHSLFSILSLYIFHHWKRFCSCEVNVRIAVKIKTNFLDIFCCWKRHDDKSISLSILQPWAIQPKISFCSIPTPSGTIMSMQRM